MGAFHSTFVGWKAPHPFVYHFDRKGSPLVPFRCILIEKSYPFSQTFITDPYCVKSLEKEVFFCHFHVLPNISNDQVIKCVSSKGPMK